MTLDEFQLMFHYILSSSFISAWYHLNREKDKRDKVAHSCCTLVAAFDPTSNDEMKIYLGREEIWKKQLSGGNGGGSHAGGSSCMVAALAIVACTCAQLVCLLRSSRNWLFAECSA